jgi:hypothetical protein
LRYEGLLGTVGGVVAVTVAVVGTTAACLIAPWVPQLRWSVRTGRLPRVREAQVPAAGRTPS